MSAFRLGTGGSPKAALLATKKECSECGVPKPLSMFNTDPRNPKLFLDKCRQCQFKRYSQNEDE